MSRIVSDTDMSPLQKRLLATYMNALDEQEAVEEEPPEPPAPPPPAAPASPQQSTPSKSRSDVYAKKMGDLLLKGWRMLGENCPETGEVPLMQHPTSGRKFSIATGRYTDEMAKAEEPEPTPPPAAPVASAPPPQLAPPAPIPAAAIAPPPPPPAAKRPGKSDQDLWCENMSALMLKGWKMLNETCPVTEAVPLMGQPKTGRKFSVAIGKFVDEIDEPVSESAPAPASPAVEELPVAALKSSPVAVEPLPRPGVSDVVPSPTPLPPAPNVRGRPVTEDAHYWAQAAVPAAPAAMPAALAAAPQAAAPPCDCLVQLGGTAGVLAMHLSNTTAQLAAAHSPPPVALLDAISQIADTMMKVGLAQRALSGA